MAQTTINGVALEATTTQADDLYIIEQKVSGVYTTKKIQHDTLVEGLADTDTVNTFTKNQTIAFSTLTSGTSIAVNAALSDRFKLTISHAGTLEAPTNLVDGMVLTFVVQKGSGGTLAYNSIYDFGTAGVPTLSDTVGKVAILCGIYESDKAKIFMNITQGFG